MMDFEAVEWMLPDEACKVSNISIETFNQWLKLGVFRLSDDDVTLKGERVTCVLTERSVARLAVTAMVAAIGMLPVKAAEYADAIIEAGWNGKQSAIAYFGFGMCLRVNLGLVRTNISSTRRWSSPVSRPCEATTAVCCISDPAMESAA